MDSKWKIVKFFFFLYGVFWEVGSRERKKAYRNSEGETVSLSITRGIFVRSSNQSLAGLFIWFVCQIFLSIGIPGEFLAYWRAVEISVENVS